MPLPAQSRLGWQVFISILHVTAISSTLVRLVHRWKRVCLWWDDWATILPLVFDVLYFAITWLSFQNKFTGSLFVSFWFTNILLMTIIWISRASLALSLARIFAPKHRCRRIAFSLCTTFVVVWVMVIILSSLECYDGEIDQWWNLPFTFCVDKRPTAKGGMYLVLAFDFLADLSLVFVPLVMLWRVKLPLNQRRLVFVLFSCSVLSLLSSVYFSILANLPTRDLGPDGFFLIDMGAKLLAGVSLIVCNVMVVATLVYRVSMAKLTPEVESVPEPKTGAPSIVVPATADRRGTSIFREVFQNMRSKKGTTIASNSCQKSESEESAPTSTTPSAPTQLDSQKDNESELAPSLIQSSLRTAPDVS